MKNIFLKILILLGLLSTFYNIGNAGKIDFTGVGDATSKISDVSMGAKSGSFETQINNGVTNGFHTFKIAIGGLLVVYLVYCGILMINSLGDNEEDLKNAKRGIRYSLVGLLFVNIPGTLYNAFSGKYTTDDVTTGVGSSTTLYTRNIFFNNSAFGNLLGNMINFMEIILFAFVIFVFVFSGIQIILDQGKGETTKTAKSRILNSILGLIFLGVIEAWRLVMYTGDLYNKGQSLFAKLANLALFFAGPVAIFFLCMAGYYYITSGGNDDKVKKAKNIVINTLLATLILLGMYTFFGDLATLSFG